MARNCEHHQDAPMEIRPFRVSRSNQSGFTLVEFAVALAVGAFLLMAVIGFFSSTFRILQKLKIERELRDVGLFAVESIEREFRRTLQYGGSIEAINDASVSAKWGGETPRTVGLEFDGNGVLTLVSNVGQSDESESTWPHGDLVCKTVQVWALEGGGDEYVEGSAASSRNVRVVVVEFELGEETYDVSRWFKAAFAVVEE